MAVSGLEEPARPSGHPVKMACGESASTLAPGGELSDLGQWGEKQVLPSCWRRLLFPQDPCVICTLTLLARPRHCLRSSTSPQPLSLSLPSERKTLSLLGDLKLYSLKTDL